MQILHVHPINPQVRLLEKAAEVIKQGGIVVYPTDSAYALGCHIGDVKALDRIRLIRNLNKNHNFTLVCSNLSEIATYSRVDNSTFRLLKAHAPGPYTFILPATKEVPKRLQHPKRKTIGFRIPDNKVVQTLLTILQEPIMSVSLILPNEDAPVSNLEEIYDKLSTLIDLIIDSGSCGLELTTVVDFVNGVPEIVRKGKGDWSAFL